MIGGGINDHLSEFAQQTKFDLPKKKKNLLMLCTLTHLVVFKKFSIPSHNNP
jgi:hypothetical protein